MVKEKISSRGFNTFFGATHVWQYNIICAADASKKEPEPFVNFYYQSWFGGVFQHSPIRNANNVNPSHPQVLKTSGIWKTSLERQTWNSPPDNAEMERFFIENFHDNAQNWILTKCGLDSAASVLQHLCTWKKRRDNSSPTFASWNQWQSCAQTNPHYIWKQ